MRSRSTALLAPLALLSVLVFQGGPVGSQATGVPVSGSVQHVYTAGGPGGIPSQEIPDCAEDEDPPGCFEGEKLVLQAASIGQTAMEPTIAVAADGTAYMAGSTIVVDTPVVYGVAKTDTRRSVDGGLTWTSVQPAIPVQGERLPPGNADPMIYLDPGTNRIFTFDLTGACQWLSYSEDRGQTWINNPFACGDIPVDHQTIVAAKPRDGLPTVLYPNVLYYCTNRLVDSACGRSINGGLTWTPSGGPAYGPLGQGCAGLHGHLEADPDGRIFLPTSQNCPSSRPWISVSEDNGQTWTRREVSTVSSATPHTSVASDSAGNLYYVWINSASGTILPYLSTSTDHGMTWSAPKMIAPPGVLQSNFPVVAGGAPGHIAISFPSTNGTAGNRPWDQTVVVSTDALSENPTFLSATANPPTNPIHRGGCGPGRCGGMWDFIDIQVSPAGQAWVAASDDCVGSCNTGTTSATKAGDGIAIRQIGGPLLRPAPTG
jgi:hypothetical protein